MLLNEQEFKTKTENHAICEELMVNQKYSRGKKTKKHDPNLFGCVYTCESKKIMFRIRKMSRICRKFLSIYYNVVEPKPRGLSFWIEWCLHVLYYGLPDKLL
jgi:hypothetical protein